MDAMITPSQVNDCWNKIGVYGDRSCKKLETVIHCRNCPVYSTAGRSLLEREIPVDYLNEWTAILASHQTQSPLAIGDQEAVRIGRATDTFSAIVFRLSNELFALPVGVLQEVTHLSAIHTLPHRSNDLFLGLVNIRGEILLCASLSHLLGLETVTEPLSSDRDCRMLVVGKNGKWVFPVDEVHRIYRFHLNEFKATPVVISRSQETYSQGVIDWHHKKVNYLNAELLLDMLARRI